MNTKIFQGDELLPIFFILGVVFNNFKYFIVPPAFTMPLNDVDVMEGGRVTF